MISLKQEFADSQNWETAYDSSLASFMITIINEAIPECAYRQKMHSLLSNSKATGGNKISINFLPHISYSIFSDTPDKGTPLTAAWQLICIAAKLFDDVEDRAVISNESQTINLANGFVFASQIALEKLVDFGVVEENSKTIRQNYHKVCLRMCSGQDKDLGTQADRIFPTPDQWLDITQDKSGILFAWATWAGGLIAGLNNAQLSTLWEYGVRLGTLIQIADDYNAIWDSSKVNLFDNLTALPICYAYYVANQNERDLLVGLLNCSQTQEIVNALQRLHVLLSSLGTEKFILAAAQIQRHEAINALLRNFPKASIQPLISLLDQAFPILENIYANE